MTLELGGKSPAIMFPDADIRNALRWQRDPCSRVWCIVLIHWDSRCSAAALINAGQVCASTSRLYLHRAIADGFNEGLKGIYLDAAQSMGPESPNPMGVPPLADEAMLERVLSYIASGKKDAKLAVGGERKDFDGY